MTPGDRPADQADNGIILKTPKALNKATTQRKQALALQLWQLRGADSCLSLFNGVYCLISFLTNVRIEMELFLRTVFSALFFYHLLVRGSAMPWTVFVLDCVIVSIAFLSICLYAVRIDQSGYVYYVTLCKVALDALIAFQALYALRVRKEGEAARPADEDSVTGTVCYGVTVDDVELEKEGDRTSSPRPSEVSTAASSITVPASALEATDV
eukprot:TRINITY_DN29443_c0_g1_i1.p1 TRINITY_DN29443_c0_g1~~TRINITY_DN29443_c0_g1_i1.p1  ORF type:complete len:212 (-),score=37.25 TRINITY_DN29443_c0_g1_i1:575-1210(-)